MTERTELAKMLAGELYDPFDAELTAARRRARDLTRRYNATTEDDDRVGLLRELLGRVGANPIIEPPFHCDYGCHITLGDNAYLNFGCVILDCNRVEIGDGVLFGPYVQVYAATHLVDPAVRRRGLEYALPIRLGHNVWVGGGAIILPGVTIGDDVTIGAGSVVTKDVPPGMLAVGDPCRVLRRAR